MTRDEIADEQRQQRRLVILGKLGEGWQKSAGDYPDIMWGKWNMQTNAKEWELEEHVAKYISGEGSLAAVRASFSAWVEAYKQVR